MTINLGEAMILSGQRDGESMLRLAVREARRRGDLIAAASALTAMATVPGGHTAGILAGDFAAIVADTIDTLPETETGWRIRLMGNLGTHLYTSHDVERGQALMDEAVEIDARRAIP